MSFSSYSQMDFHCTSRRDDLIALLYLLTFLLNGGILLGHSEYDLNLTQVEFFELMKQTKRRKHPCTEKAKCLKQFGNEIFRMGFQTKPDYEKLKELLIDAIDMEKIPEET